MIRAQIVKTIALKELKESLRDRRTLFLMIFVPILLYPMLFLVVTEVAVSQQSKLASETTQVQVVGLPEEHTLLKAFEEDPEISVTVADEKKATDESLDVVLTLAPQSEDGAPPDPNTLMLQAHFRSVEEASAFGKQRVEKRLSLWQEEEVARRLAAHELAPSLARPASLEWVDEANDQQRGGHFLAMVLPLIVVMTVMLGAFYPSIDLTAGEKERGSIQTLFTAPISVLEIVAGKYLAVLVIALISGMANLLSMALVFGFIGSQMGGVEASVTPSALIVLFVAILLIATLFGALMLALAIMARDYKDAQNFLSPIFMVITIPAMIAQMPGVDLNTTFALAPAMNVILLMKAALMGELVAELLFLVTASSLIYTALTLVFAAKVFSQERVVVGDRGSFQLLLPPSQIKARPRPGVGEGLAWFGIAFVLLFYLGGWAQRTHPQAGLLITLWLLLLLPTLGLSRYLKLDFKETFSLRKPPLLSLLATLLMAISAWILVSSIDFYVVQRFLHTPPELAEAMMKIFPEPESALGWGGLFFLIAISPGICEEVVFRGFLFSSLKERVPGWAVVGISALAFAAFHLSLYRLFGTFTLGLVMGWLVLRTRSIFPAMLFHAVNNGLGITAAYTLLKDNEVTPPAGIAGAAVVFVIGAALLVVSTRTKQMAES